MAYELHGLLAGNVSVVTGENIRPSYGGDDEAFLKKVITPIYRVIERVCFLTSKIQHFTLSSLYGTTNNGVDLPGSKQKQKWKSSTFSMV